MPTDSVRPDTFTAKEFARRWSAVGAELEKRGLDAIVVTAQSHLTYLTGYHRPWQFTIYPLTLSRDQPPTLVVRLFEEDSARAESSVKDIVPYGDTQDPRQALADVLRSRGLARGRVGMELDCWWLAPSDVAAVRALVPQMEIVDASDLVGKVSEVKSDEEVAVHREAMRLTQLGVEAFYRGIKPGATEATVTSQVIKVVSEAGSEFHPTAPPEVVFGDRTALPHALFTLKALSSGDVAFIEHSGVIRRYCSPLVRTAILGRNSRAEHLHAVSEEAQQAALQALRPGVTTGAIDAACRGVVERAGLANSFRHRTGYAVGIGWTDRGSTSLKAGGQEVLEAGMMFHMPTILFEPGQFAVGCSETALITGNGNQVLSSLPRSIFYG